MVTLFVEITAQAGKEELFFDALKAMLEPSRAEKGCRDYRIAQSDTNPVKFFTFERFESMDDFEQHKSSEHYAKFIATIGEFLAEEPRIEFATEL